MKKSLATIEQRVLQSLLIECREKVGLKQTELATRLAVPQSFVSKYENGERRLDVIELRSICVALETTLPLFCGQLEQALSKHVTSPAP